MLVTETPTRFSCYTETVTQRDSTRQQNVTISLSSDLMREARHLAVDEGMSLSRFISALLEQEVEGRRRYHTARERQSSLLRKGLPLGTHGQITWQRSELHER
jgi:hypothetical protein